ncbi:deaminase domain-containing protein [Pseudomonas sp. TE3610]
MIIPRQTLLNIGPLLTALLNREDFSAVDPLASDQHWQDNLEQLSGKADVIALLDAPSQPLPRYLQAQASATLETLGPQMAEQLRSAYRQARPGRRVFSAASLLWRQAAFATPTHCAWLACLLVYPELEGDNTAEHNPAESRIGTFEHLETDLSTCVARVLHSRTGSTRCARLLDYLQMDFGLACSSDPKRLMPCLFGCATFAAFETALIHDLQWTAPAQGLRRELAMQAMVDYLDPPSGRVEDQLAGVALNTSNTAKALREQLDTALMNTLGCSRKELAVVATLLLRARAPLLLLSDLPDDFEHLPDLYTVQLKLGIHLAGQEPWFLDRDTAQRMPSVRQALAHSDRQRATLLLARMPLVIHWAEYHQILPAGAAHTTAQLMDAMKVFDTMAALTQLTEPPSRMKQGIEYLRAFSINPHQLVPGNRHTTYLESLIDSGKHFRHPALKATTPPDITALFKQHFNAYRGNCRRLLRDLISLFIQHLPDATRQVLRGATLQAYAVQWYEYIGPNPGSIPALEDADPASWAVRRCPALLIHCQGQEGETLHRWFPQHWRWDSQAIDRQGLPLSQWAREHLPLSFDDYHDAEQPFTYSTAGRLQAVGSLLPAGDPSRLVDTARDHVWMHHFDALEQQCQGMTQVEYQAKAIQERSTAAYLARLGIPFASCFDPQGVGGVSNCVMDAVTLPLSSLAPVLRTLVANRRLINRLLHSGGRTPLVNTTLAISRWLYGQQRSGSFNFARYYDRALRSHGRGTFSRSSLTPATAAGQSGATVNGQQHVAVLNQGTPRHADWRLLDPLTRHAYGPRLLDLSPHGPRRLLIDTAAIARPGLKPGALVLHKAADGSRYLQAHVDSQVMLVHRPDRSVDVLIDGTLYRRGNTPHYVRIDRLAATRRPRPMVETATPCRVPRAPNPGSDCASLYMHQVRVNAPPANATLGQQAAHAWQARTYHLASLAIAAGSRTDVPDNIDILLLDGTVWRRPRQRPGSNRLVRVTDQERRQFSLPLAGTNGTEVDYLPRISGRFAADRRFGLHASVTEQQALAINDAMPAIELDALVSGINDRRVLRGHVMDHPQGPCIEIEADTHVLYRAFLRPGPLVFERITDPLQIDHFFRTTETYRIVGTTPTAVQDRQNVARLLFDMAKLRPAPGDLPLAPYPDYAAYAQAMGRDNELVAYAVNILAGNAEQLRLFELTKTLIPDRAYLTERPPAIQQAQIDILNRLAPPQATPPIAFTPITLQTIGDAQVHTALRRMMAGANIAFIQATLQDGRQIVYYALSGGQRAAALRLNIDLATRARQVIDGVEWVDARAIMRTRGPDPEMTSLPVVRYSHRKVATPHSREQDAERLIATVLKADLRGQAVTDLQVFTRMDTCRSCGAIVLPQLQVLFPQARMSVSYLEPYAID